MRLSKRHTISWATTSKVNTPDPFPMSQEEFQFLCTQLHINDAVTASEMFGVNWRTAQRYWYGKLPPPPPLARLLRLAYHCDLDLDNMRDLSPISTPKNTRHSL